MKSIYLSLILFFSFFSTLSAQTTHEVEVANFQFSPANLEIEVGDIVRWMNVSGTHSVDGTEESFPDNPAFFGNDIASGDWTYEFTFDIEGEYEYVCGVHSGMLGFISVGSVQSTDEATGDPVSFFPNPAVQFVEIQGLSELRGTIRLELFDVNGKLLKDEVLNSQNRLNLEEYASGVLTYVLYQNDSVLQKGKLIKE